MTLFDEANIAYTAAPTSGEPKKADILEVWRNFDEFEFGADYLKIGPRLQLVNVDGGFAQVQTINQTGRQEGTFGYGMDVFMAGSRGANFRAYGNADSEHGTANGAPTPPVGGPAVICAGPDDGVNAVAFFTADFKFFMDGNGGGWDRHDGADSDGNALPPLYGMMNLVNPQGQPAIVIESASATEGDIAVLAGQKLQLGAWDPIASMFAAHITVNTVGSLEGSGGIYGNGVTAGVEFETAVEGFAYNRGGSLSISRDSGTVAEWNRLGSDGPIVAFHNDGLKVADITINAATVSYNTTSDSRLKTDLQEFDGLATVESLKVFDFEWTKIDSRGRGVIAQDAFSVAPYAVKEGDESELWGVDYSKLVPDLIRAVQQLSDRIRALENN